MNSQNKSIRRYDHNADCKVYPLTVVICCADWVQIGWTYCFSTQTLQSEFLCWPWRMTCRLPLISGLNLISELYCILSHNCILGRAWTQNETESQLRFSIHISVAEPDWEGDMSVPWNWHLGTGCQIEIVSQHEIDFDSDSKASLIRIFFHQGNNIHIT